MNEKRDQRSEFLILCICLASFGLQIGLLLGYYLANFRLLCAVWLVVVWFVGWVNVIYIRWYIDQWHSDKHR